MDRDPLFDFAVETINDCSFRSAKAAQLNLQSDIPWGLRERIRTIQGLFDKAEDAAIDMLVSHGTDEAAEWLADHYDMLVSRGATTR